MLQGAWFTVAVLQHDPAVPRVRYARTMNNIHAVDRTWAPL